MGKPRRGRRLSAPHGFELDPDHVADAVGIDLDQLGAEQARVSSDLYYFSRVLATLAQKRQRQQVALDRWCARRREEIRLELAERSRLPDRNPTAARINDQLRLDELHNTLEDAIIELDAQIASLDIIIRAIREKAQMLIGLSADEREGRKHHR